MRYILIRVLICLVISTGLKAQDREGASNFSPQSTYFNSYLKREDARKFLELGKHEEAEKALRTSLLLLNVIKQSEPDFKPKLISAKIAETQSLIASIKPSADAARRSSEKKGAEIIGKIVEENPKNKGSNALKVELREINNLNRQIIGLRQQLKNAKKANDSLKSQLSGALKKLEIERKSKASAPLLAEIAQLKDQLLLASKERDALKNTLEKNRKEKLYILAENSRLKAEKADIEKKRADIEKEIAEQRGVNNSIVRALRKRQTEIGKQLDEKNATLLASQRKVANLEARINQAQVTITELKSERNELLSERDDLQRVLSNDQNKRTQQLISQNVILSKKLREQKKLIDTLAKSDDATKDQLIAARSELDLTKSRLRNVIANNSEQKRRLKAYRQRLADAEAQLAAGGGSADNRDIALLKSTLRLLQRREVVRSKASQALMDAAKKQGVFDELSAEIRAVAGNPMQLSEEQRAIIAPTPPTSAGTTLKTNTNAVSPDVRKAAERRLSLSIKSYTNAGRRAYVAGRYEIAAELFAAALDENPGHVNSHINLGVSKLQTGDLEGASASFRSAITLRETSYYAHQMLGATLYKMGFKEEAKKSFTLSLALRKENPKSLVFLGTIAASEGDLKLAEEHFIAALDIDNKLPTPLYNMARIYASRGEKAKARTFYERSLASGAAADPSLEATILK